MVEESISDGFRKYIDYRRQYPPDPAHPIRTALGEALTNIWERVLQSFDKIQALNRIPVEERDEADVEAVMKECLDSLERGLEIKAWLSPPFRPFSVPAAIKATAGMRELGYTDDEIEDFFRALTTNRRGRPMKARSQGIKALEKHLFEGWSWRRLANNLCDCGQSAHDHKCRERLRQIAIKLNRVLKKYHCMQGCK